MLQRILIALVIFLRRRRRLAIFFFKPMSIPSEANPPTNSGELPIIEACLDLIRWFVPLLQRLPRQHRFGLGDRLIGHLYHLLEQLAKQHSGWLSQQLQQLPAEPHHA
jgi:hypothetical protein